MTYQRIFRTYFLYKLIFKYVRCIHAYILHRSYTVYNAANIPTGKPFIMVANHQHGILDALALLFMIKDGRYPVFMARADVFKNNYFAQLLVFFRLLPAFRMQDVGKNKVLENEKVFETTAQLLANHTGILALFPEGGHQEKQQLGKFKKGFARIAFQTASYTNFETEVLVLPVGIHHIGGLFQSKVSVYVGKPISVLTFQELYMQQPEKAQQQLLEQTAAAVSSNMLDIKETTYYSEYLVLCTIARIYRKNNPAAQVRYATDLAIEQAVINRLELLKAHQETEYVELMKLTKNIDELIVSLHLSYELVFESKKSTAERIVQFFTKVLFFPIQMFAFVHQIIPFWMTKYASKHAEDELLKVSMQLGLGAIIVFPLWNSLLVLIAFLLGLSIPFILVYAISLVFSVWVFFRSIPTWKEFHILLRLQDLSHRQCPALKVMGSFYHVIVAKLSL
jgi:1-acyl-sn-glycerol-3-phosphate acyltransferase